MVKKRKTLSEQAYREAAECLRVIAHPHRLQILQLLLSEAYTVGELAEKCGIASSVCSEHLRTMQRCGFLVSERQGRQIFYRVSEPHIERILQCVESRFAD